MDGDHKNENCSSVEKKQLKSKYRYTWYFCVLMYEQALGIYNARIKQLLSFLQMIRNYIFFRLSSIYSYLIKVKVKAVPLHAWSGPEGSRKLR